MAVKPFSKEQLNFFKFSTLVLDEFPIVLRKIFITMWDTKVATRPEFIVWDDSIEVRNMLLKSEGGKTDIPTTKSIEEWDCTALFKATIYAKTFGRPGSKGTTLNDLYLKTVKSAPGSFHSSVQSSTGNQDETYALVIDQLRLLRNTLCHSPKPEIVKTKFDHYIELATDSLSAVNVDTAFVVVIGQMNEEDFPTTKVEELSKCFVKELQTMSMFHENMEQRMDNMEQKMDNMYTMMKSTVINSEDKESKCKPDSPSEQSCPTRNLAQETENPAKTSRLESLATIVQPCVEPFPNTPDCPQISQAACQQPFEPRELTRIAQRINDVWRPVAELTNIFKDWELDNIFYDANLQTPIAKANCMLKGFKSRLGKREVLAKAISESGKLDVAANVRSGSYIY